MIKELDRSDPDWRAITGDEVARWKAKSYADLRVALSEVVAYDREGPGGPYQVEVQLLEPTRLPARAGRGVRAARAGVPTTLGELHPLRGWPTRLRCEAISHGLLPQMRITTTVWAPLVLIIGVMAFLIFEPIPWLVAYHDVSCPDGAVLMHSGKEQVWYCALEVPKDDPRLNDRSRAVLLTRTKSYLLHGPQVHYDWAGRRFGNEAEYRAGKWGGPSN
jgi:hypothetical protein